MRSIIVLSYNSSDYPDQYVLREHILEDGRYIAVHGEPIAVRFNPEPLYNRMAAEGRMFIVRDKDDDPVIVGTFV